MSNPFIREAEPPLHAQLFLIFGAMLAGLLFGVYVGRHVERVHTKKCIQVLGDCVKAQTTLITTCNEVVAAADGLLHGVRR